MNERKENSKSPGLTLLAISAALMLSSTPGVAQNTGSDQWGFQIAPIYLWD